MSIIEQNHTTFKTFECYLIGKTISQELQRKKKFRSTQFRVRTFSDIIDDTEKRYKEFLKTMQS